MLSGCADNLAITDCIVLAGTAAEWVMEGGKEALALVARVGRNRSKQCHVGER
jgi:hypothetical protein